MATTEGRLAGRTALVFGGGQIPGETVGNGRATALTFAREGARLLIADINPGSAEETCRLARDQGGTAEAIAADVTEALDCRAAAERCLESYGQIDILFNNVGIGIGDCGATDLSEAAWRSILDANLTGMFLTCKHVLPAMRERRSGAIVNMSSILSVASDSQLSSTTVDPKATGGLAYKVSKAGVDALTHSLAMANAPFGIRVNAVLPGLIDAPNAIEPIAAGQGISRAELRRQRDASVPLGGAMGTAWDVANAALFLASEEARFITNVLLPVDGGQLGLIG